MLACPDLDFEEVIFNCVKDLGYVDVRPLKSFMQEYLLGEEDTLSLLQTIHDRTYQGCKDEDLPMRRFQYLWDICSLGLPLD